MLLLGGAALLGGTALMTYLRAREAEQDRPPRGRFVRVGGVRLHYLERGSGGPPIVLLHGNGATSEDFAISGLLDRLAGKHRVIAFDRPGYGYSERPRDRIWTPEAQAALLRTAIERLGLERPVIVGHSWGTLVAVAMALGRPEALRGLVLLSGYYFPTVRKDVAIFSPPAVPVIGDVLRYTVSPIFGRLIAPLLFRKNFRPRRVPPRFRREFPLELALRPWQIRASAEETALMIPAAARMSARYRTLRAPVTLLAGRDDQIADVGRQSGRLAREIPHSRSHRLPGLGHMIHYFAQDEIVEAVDETIGRTDRPAETAAASALPSDSEPPTGLAAKGGDRPAAAVS